MKLWLGSSPHASMGIFLPPTLLDENFYLQIFFSCVNDCTDSTKVARLVLEYMVFLYIVNILWNSHLLGLFFIAI